MRSVTVISDIDINIDSNLYKIYYNINNINISNII